MNNLLLMFKYARLTIRAILPAWLIVMSMMASAEDSRTEVTEIVVISTTLGDIKVALYPHAAPLTVAHFLHLVDNKQYDKSSFYRAVRPETSLIRKVANGETFSIKQGGILQGGFQHDKARVRKFSLHQHESTQMTGLKHRTGSITLARAHGGAAFGEFFISIGEHPYYDHGGIVNDDGQGYAVFGQVIDGMDIVKAIHQHPTVVKADHSKIWDFKNTNINSLTDAEKQQLYTNQLKQPVPILSIRRQTEHHAE